MHFLRIECLLILHAFWKCTVIADFNNVLTELPVPEYLDLRSINNTDNFRSIIKDTIGKPWDDQIIRCLRPSDKCEKLQNSSCYDGKLPYRFTSSQLASEPNQYRSLDKLYQFEALRYVPKCWAVIQPFLCAVYLPKCTRVNDQPYVYLPSFEMCRVTTEPCRILYNTDFFPPNLKCNRKVFSCDNCQNDVRDIKFNTMGQCMPPLVPTEWYINHYPDIEGCGLQCEDPMYTIEEHESVQSLIFYGALICIICNLFVIATFLIHDWKHTKHPAWNLFFISICFLCNWVGWIMQFVPGNRENIVCRRDGTLRFSEPNSSENLSCIIPFIMIYYSLIVANLWFVIFTYTWYLQTKHRGSIRDRIDKESFYFHFIAWALPFILTVAIMVLSEVDGNSIIGICFVGYRNRAMRNGFVLLPIAILSLISVFFTFKGALNLNRIKRSTSNSDESKKLSSHIFSMGFRTMLVVIFIWAFFIFENYETRNKDLWTKSLNDLIICKIRESFLGDMTKCKLQYRPSVNIVQLRLLCLFCVNLVISSWCWTWPALKSWKRFTRKKIGYELSDDEKFNKPKHRIIADAYAKRMDDVFSVSLRNPHTDPACLNFDMNNLNSAESGAIGNTLTKSFTNYLCNIINRRNAVTTMDFNETNANCIAYTSSCADHNSEISFSLRHISVGSRRDSLDSQLSVKCSKTNIKATQKRKKGFHMKEKKLQNKYLFKGNRRASSSSVESQRITNQVQEFRYEDRQHIQVSASGQQIERQSTCTLADVNDFNGKLNENSRNVKQLTLTSDNDDQSNDELNQNNVDNLNMLVPLNAQPNQMADSVDSLDASNYRHHDNFIMNFIRLSSEKHAQNMRRSKNQHHTKIEELETKNEDTSMSSSTDIGILQNLDGTQSSFSDQSIDHINTQSQNSKSSCDIGRKANDYDDNASHSRQLSHNDTMKDDDEKLQSNYQHDDDYTETHQLIPQRKPPPTIIHTMNGMHLSESEKKEKLFQLLLPSNRTELN